MASGRLGKADLAANTDVTLFTVASESVATVNINVCNRGAVNALVRIAIREGALGAADYIEYDAIVPPNGVIERTGIVMSAGEAVVCRAGAAGVSARVHGFEEKV